jgi:hypothetical protein
LNLCECAQIILIWVCVNERLSPDPSLKLVRYRLRAFVELEKTHNITRLHTLKMNPAKCVFGFIFFLELPGFSGTFFFESRFSGT